MKRVLLFSVLALSLALLGTQPAFAVTVIHDAIYHWMEGGTTVVDQTDLQNVIVYNIGNPTGDDYIQVWEKAKDNGVFQYSLRNDDYVDIYSFHVPSGGIPNIISHTEPAGWTFSMDSQWLTWVTTTDPATTTSGGKDFSVWTYGTGRYAISTSAVDTDLAHTSWVDGNGFWVASHPVPEPATLSLIMGISLMGFAGRVVRKRFIA